MPTNSPRCKLLGGDGKALAALAPFAATGVPTRQTLAHELAALIPQMLKIAGAPPPSADFLGEARSQCQQAGDACVR